MTRSVRRTVTATRLLVATGLTTGVSAGLAIGTTAGAAGGVTPHGSGDSCPNGSVLEAGDVCQVVIDQSGHWTIPKGVKTLSVLAVGGGGGGGGGTTYGPGGGGGGGGTALCTTTVADLSGSLLLVSIGAGGSGGADGTANPSDGDLGDEYGSPGIAGGGTVVVNGTFACGAEGGSAGAPGYNWKVDDQPDGPYYGGGGESGNGLAGGSASGLLDGNVNDCVDDTIAYNIVASGGGGAGTQGSAPADNTSGNGGAGVTPHSGLFAHNTTSYGGGGGGGGGTDCQVSTGWGTGGSGGGGNGGWYEQSTDHPATAGAAHFGGGGGGGGGTYPGDGIAGGNGGSGTVVIRFAAFATIKATVYFATASSTLTAQDKATIDTFATELVEQGRTTAHVVGYADPRGTVPYNKKLSAARAASAAAFLEARLSVMGDHVSVTAVGDGVKSNGATYADDRVADLSS